MRAAVVVFPGSNADAEMIHTLRGVLGLSTEVVWHKEGGLPGDVDLVAIPGGFSYGDYLRAGAIAKTSPMLGAIRQHAERGGFVLGVCNGFQILTEAGLLAGALVRNRHLRFECRDVFVEVATSGPFSPRQRRVLRLPIAHADGRYHCDEATADELERTGRIAFRYVDREGTAAPSANPNGSVRSIAGVYGGPQKNVLGLMPHPERAAEPAVGSDDGLWLFKALVDFQRERPRGT